MTVGRSRLEYSQTGSMDDYYFPRRMEAALRHRVSNAIVTFVVAVWEGFE